MRGSACRSHARDFTIQEIATIEAVADAIGDAMRRTKRREFPLHCRIRDSGPQQIPLGLSPFTFENGGKHGQA